MVFFFDVFKSVKWDAHFTLEITMNPYLLGALCLILDLVGACFVAYEVVLQYRGQKYRDISTIDSINDLPFELPEYTKWEGRKYKFMLTGLVILFVGCAVQLLGLWIGYKTYEMPQSQAALYNQTKIHAQPLVSSNSANPKIIMLYKKQL